MNKQDLVKALALETQFKEKDCLAFINAFTTAVTEELSKRGTVKLVGFGTFSTRESKGRMGRNPKTGDPVVIEDKVVAKFKPGKYLKSQVLKSNI
jgi:DNA-binding protein HU-beta